MNFMTKLNPYLYHIARVTENTKVNPVEGFQKRYTLFHEIEWITKGSGVMMSKGERIHVQAGDILYREPGVDMKASGSYQCYLLVFDPFIHTKGQLTIVEGVGGNRFIGNYITKEEAIHEEPLPLPKIFHPVSDSVYEALFTELAKAFSSDVEDKELVMKIKCLEIIKTIMNDSTNLHHQNDYKLMFKRHSKKLESVIKDINNKPWEKIILEEMANKVGLSKYHFSRLFRNYTGVNVSTFHKNVRLNHAKHLLINTDDTIETIALASGFETPTYFYKVFRKNINLTPQQYREQFII